MCAIAQLLSRHEAACNSLVRNRVWEETRRRHKVPKDKPNTITAEIEMLGVSNDTEQQLRSPVSQKIRKSLSYPEMSCRYEDIIEAHQETFEWALSGR
jgi:hypothetical protein